MAYKKRERQEDDYKTNIRISREEGEFIQELAHRNKSSITFEISRCIREEMARHPALVAELEKRRNEDG